MSIIKQGTETLKIVRDNSLEDIYEIKERLNQRIDYTYAEDCLSKQDIDNEFGDDNNTRNYEGHDFENSKEYLSDLYENGFDEDGSLYSYFGEELYYSESIYDPFSIYYKRGKYIIILNSGFDLYKCDICKGLFVDYLNFYASEKSDKVLGGKDCCASCYPSLLQRFRRRNILEALNKLSDINGVKISKQQKHVSQVLNGETNVQIGRFFADIVIEEERLVIEYDGGGHWLSAVFDKNITKEDIDERDVLRDKYLNKKGYNVMRIVSEKDLLPSDKEIQKLHKKASKEFTSGKKVVRYDMEKLYDKENLRKIEVK